MFLKNLYFFFLGLLFLPLALCEQVTFHSTYVNYSRAIAIEDAAKKVFAEHITVKYPKLMIQVLVNDYEENYIQILSTQKKKILFGFSEKTVVKIQVNLTKIKRDFVVSSGKAQLRMTWDLSHEFSDNFSSERDKILRFFEELLEDDFYLETREPKQISLLMSAVSPIVLKYIKERFSPANGLSFRLVASKKVGKVDYSYEETWYQKNKGKESRIHYLESKKGLRWLPRKNEKGEVLIFMEDDYNITHKDFLRFSYNQLNQSIEFEMTKEGSKKFAELTSQNINEQVAIIFEDEVIATPVIMGSISHGKGLIQGFSRKEFHRLEKITQRAKLSLKGELLEEGLYQKMENFPTQKGMFLRVSFPENAEMKPFFSEIKEKVYEQKSFHQNEYQFWIETEDSGTVLYRLSPVIKMAGGKIEQSCNYVPLLLNK